MNEYELDTSSYIGTIKNNFIILSTLFFALILITNRNIERITGLHDSKQGFAESTARYVLNQKSIDVMNVKLSNPSSNTEFKSVILEKSKESKQFECSLVMNDNEEETCFFEHNSYSNIRELLIRSINTYGFCSLENEGLVNLKSNVRKDCAENFIKFSLVTLKTTLEGMYEEPINQPKLTINAYPHKKEGSDKSSTHISVWIDGLNTHDESDANISAYDLDIWNESGKFKDIISNNGLSCTGQSPHTPSCFYKQLNEFSLKISNDSASLPYLAFSLPSKVAAIIIMALIIFVNLSCYSASKIALKNIPTGLNQGFALLDIKGSLAKYLLRFGLTLTFSMSFAMCLFIVIPIELVSEIVSQPWTSHNSSKSDKIWSIASICGYFLTFLLIQKFQRPLVSAMLSLREERQKRLWE